MSLTDKLPKKKRKRLYPYNPYSDMIKLLGGWGVYLWYRPKVHRINEKVPRFVRGGALIAANHSSRQDPIILFSAFWYRRLTFLATKELFAKRINRFFFKNMNCILVDRDNFNVSSIKKVNDRLNQNKAVVIFPEGSINRRSELLEFKKGTAFLAQKAKKPVVPVFIAHGRSPWHRSHVVVGEPIDVNSLMSSYPRGEAIIRVSEILRDKELELSQYYNTYIKKDGNALEK